MRQQCDGVATFTWLPGFGLFIDFGDVWHLHEVVANCAGEKFWLWRAVDQNGFVLEEILQKRREKGAAKRLLTALMKRYGFIIPDKLRSYGTAKADVAPGLDHWSHKGLNNRAENSHLPYRKRERTMQGHRSPVAGRRSPVAGSVARIRLDALRKPQLLFSSFPPPDAQTIRYHRLETFDAWKTAPCIA